MQRSGGGAVFGEIYVNARRPLIPDVRRLNQMVAYATIRADDDTQPLLHADWLAYIDNATDLVRPEGRPGRNPANGQPIILRPPADTVHFVQNGERMATFSWGPPEFNCINVDFDTANTERVLERARLIASALKVSLHQE